MRVVAAMAVLCGCSHAFTPLAPRRAALGRRMARMEESAEVAAEADRVVAELEGKGVPLPAEEEEVLKWMPSVEPGDPIVDALRSVCNVNTVESFELLDSRWNGNEALRYITDKGDFFIKMNRVEHPSVFMSEAVSLSAIAKTETIRVPLPLHVSTLPRVGEFGPGSFMILEHLPLVPFGSMRPDAQRGLGERLAELHLSPVHDSLHQGRFGFPVSNFLSLTPLNNTWTPAGMDPMEAWVGFFGNRLMDQAASLLKDKVYGRKTLESEQDEVFEAVEAVYQKLPEILSGADLSTVSLLHGDLWVGNTGAIKDVNGPKGATTPVIYDPASFFGHAEFELSIMTMFGGIEKPFFDAYHARIPKVAGFERRKLAYQMYHYVNQLNLFGDPSVKGTIVALSKEILKDETV